MGSNGGSGVDLARVDLVVEALRVAAKADDHAHRLTTGDDGAMHTEGEIRDAVNLAWTVRGVVIRMIKSSNARERALIEKLRGIDKALDNLPRGEESVAAKTLGSRRESLRREATKAPKKRFTLPRRSWPTWKSSDAADAYGLRAGRKPNGPYGFYRCGHIGNCHCPKT
jgi:hypothetical protein